MAIAQVTGVVHISLPVNDLQESIQFYKDILGFKERGKIGIDGFCLMAGETPIILTQRPEPLPPEQAKAQVGQLCHQAFYVQSEDYDAAQVQIRERGIPIDGEDWRKTGVFTGRSFYFFDPSGNRLEINDPTPPFWPENLEEAQAQAPRQRLWDEKGYVKQE
jgi:catechol 2,3-dioxygenase-like lactoylglutathione lyase family enzyme